MHSSFFALFKSGQICFKIWNVMGFFDLGSGHFLRIAFKASRILSFWRLGGTTSFIMWSDFMAERYTMHVECDNPLLWRWVKNKSTVSLFAGRAFSPVLIQNLKYSFCGAEYVALVDSAIPCSTRSVAWTLRSENRQLPVYYYSGGSRHIFIGIWVVYKKLHQVQSG